MQIVPIVGLPWDVRYVGFVVCHKERERESDGGGVWRKVARAGAMLWAPDANRLAHGNGVCWQVLLVEVLQHTADLRMGHEVWTEPLPTEDHEAVWNLVEINFGIAPLPTPKVAFICVLLPQRSQSTSAGKSTQTLSLKPSLVTVVNLTFLAS